MKGWGKPHPFIHKEVTMKITYWSDYACPYCWIGETRLKKAIAEIPELKDCELEMKAFQLDPTAGTHAESDTQTRFAHKYRISYEAAGEQINAISEMGREEGLDFNYGTTLFTNTMDAHRLTKLAYSKNNPELTQKLTEKLFEAYFSKNKELADHDLLKQTGMECGLDEKEIETLLSSDQYRDEVLLDEREAQRYGITAVPFFIIGHYGIAGAQSKEGMKAAIMKALEDEQETETVQGMSCGPEGCRIR